MMTQVCETVAHTVLVAGVVWCVGLRVRPNVGHVLSLRPGYDALQCGHQWDMLLLFGR